MSAVFAFVLRFLGGSVLSKVMDHLKLRMQAETEQERMRTEITIEEIRGEIAARQAAREIVVAEQGWWVTAMIRPAFAWPLIVWWAAVIADSLFHFNWNVAALPAPLDEWSGWIVAAYFMTRPFEKIGRGAVSRWGKAR